MSESVKRRVKVGVVGCGYMAQAAHLPCLAAQEAAELVALYDPRPDVAGAVASRWGAPRVCAGLEELLDRVDAVLVLSPAAFHRANISEALAAGKPVFTEKPLAFSSDSARELAQMARAAGLSLLVGYMKQHEDAVRAFVNLRSGAPGWGDLLFARTHAFVGRGWNAAARRLHPVYPGKNVAMDYSAAEHGPAWIEGKRDAAFYSFDHPYVALLDTGCHSVNLLRHLSGRPPRVVGARNDGRVRRAEFDLAGAPAAMEFCVNFAMHRWDEITELYYERAAVRVATPPPLGICGSACVEIHSEEGDEPRLLRLGETHRWAFENQLRFFIDAVRREDVVNNGAEAAEDIAVLEEIYRRETGVPGGEEELPGLRPRAGHLPAGTTGRPRP